MNFRDQVTKSLWSLAEKITEKKIDYYEKYHHRPCYVKIPLWLYTELLQQCDNMSNPNLEFRNMAPERLCGLLVCPTVSIEQISEIEVF